MIYFLESPARRFTAVKIGYSKSVEGAWNRLRSCQTGNPDDLEFLHIIEGDMATEREYHERFRDLRISPDGEWFRFSPELRKEIERLLKTTPSIRELEKRFSVSVSHVSTEAKDRTNAMEISEVIWAAYERNKERTQPENACTPPENP